LALGLLKQLVTEDTSMSIAKYTLVGCALSLAACAANVEDAALEDGIATSDEALCGSAAPIDLDVRRSLVVTEQPILQGFTFERVMNQLVSQARVPGLTATTLFQRWWDSQNRAPGAFTDAAHCDDHSDGELTTINDFPYDCRQAPAEGSQATCNPFTDAACAYIPVGLFNRFDLAPEDGSSCGEYRIVFAKATGQLDGRDRNLLIFEASMPNPEPRRGLAGCRPIVDFWAQLSLDADMASRAKKLEKFYFDGLGHGIPAVVDYRHFGDNNYGRGQVRTNQFVQAGIDNAVWTLREFKLYKDCERNHHAESCKLDFVPVTDKVNPWGGLFADNATHEEAPKFQKKFLKQVDSLAASDLLSISMKVDDRFNSAQSHASSRNTDTNYLEHFDDAGNFADDIQERLDDSGSELTPSDIVARAQTQSCAGCHQLSNNVSLGGGLVWPRSLNFVHVSEREPETVDGVERFRISEALTGTFLPHRKTVMEQYLRGRHTHRGDTMGGRYSH
jgi:hypothetical protein